MQQTLTETEARVLGCLIEKELTTPEYYPLSLNALVSACNQKSNRDPIASYGEADVEQEIDSLRQKGLVQSLLMPGGRTPKYRHSFLEEFNLIPREAAILCELILRLRQTPGELKGRASRMYKFQDLTEVQDTLLDLSGRAEPLVLKLEREPGKKEQRYVHLLCGPPASPESPQLTTPASAAPAAPVAPAAPAFSPEPAPSEAKQINELEAEVDCLRAELSELKQSFEEFKASFQ